MQAGSHEIAWHKVHRAELTDINSTIVGLYTKMGCCWQRTTWVSWAFTEWCRNVILISSDPVQMDKLSFPCLESNLCRGLTLPFWEGQKGIVSAGWAWSAYLNFLREQESCKLVLEIQKVSSFANLHTELCSSQSLGQFFSPQRIKKETLISTWLSFRYVCVLKQVPRRS